MFWKQTTEALFTRWDVAIDIDWLVKETPLVIAWTLETVHT